MTDPKFLLCYDPTPEGGDTWWVLHTDSPRFLAKVIRNPLADNLMIMVNSYDEITSPDPVLMSELGTFIDVHVPV